MISIICFIVVIFGSMNWLSIGFFQYDLVAGLFGYQGSIFSRIVYIVVGIAAIYLIFAIIKNKGRLTVNKLKKQEQPMVDTIMKKDDRIIEKDKKVAEELQLREEIKQEIKDEMRNKLNENSANITENNSNSNSNSNSNNNNDSDNNNNTV